MAGPSLDPSDPRYEQFRKKGLTQYDPGVFQGGENFYTLDQQGNAQTTTKAGWAKAHPGQDVFDVGGYKRSPPQAAPPPPTPKKEPPPTVPPPPPIPPPAPVPAPTPTPAPAPAASVAGLAAAAAPTLTPEGAGGTPPEMPMASPSLQGLRSAAGGEGPGMVQELPTTGLRPGLGTRIYPMYSAALAGLRSVY